MPFTEADLQAMERRVGKNKGTLPPADAHTGPESELHNDIINHCKQRGWIYFHGSMAHRAMRVLGEPDFTIMADHGRVFFIECKTKTGKLSPEQLGLKMWAEKLGHSIHTVRSMSEFLQIVSPKST